MNFFKSFSKTLIVILILVSIFFIYLGCGTRDINKDKNLKNDNGDIYAGSLVCSKCHSSIYKDFIHTAHFHTSSLPIEKNIKGSFQNEENVFPFNYSTFMLMEKRNGKFYQTEYQNGKEVRSEEFYIVVGSGTRGQSYLYKSDSQLYQLPISYFTNSDSWANSPGFPFYEPIFSRHVTPTCMECHSTFVDMSSIGTTDKNGNPTNMIFGVECESCHGPGQKHVEFEEQNSGSKEAKFIINPSKLSREQKIEMCAYCHSNGKRLNTSKPFTFKPGDSLNKYLLLDNSKFDTAHIDVHGNQTALLMASKCFKMSQLVCTTCHNTHQQERGELTLFSQRCMSCHNTEHNSFCKFEGLTSSVLKTNCIDCHMPAKSKTLTVNLNQSSKQTPAIIRSHFITVYPDETKKFLQKNKLASD